MLTNEIMQIPQPGDATDLSHSGIDQLSIVCSASFVRPCPAILQLMPCNDHLLLLCARQESPKLEIRGHVEHSLCAHVRISQLRKLAAAIHHNSTTTSERSSGGNPPMPPT
jgi:hypothetical protein